MENFLKIRQNIKNKPFFCCYLDIICAFSQKNKINSTKYKTYIIFTSSLCIATSNNLKN